MTMIPRFKPYLDKKEFVSLFRTNKNAVQEFEFEFARIFGARHALAFSYGRSALWAFFKSMKIENSEIIMPAYTCSVVAHAIVLSGNKPRFVDINLEDYNMDLHQVRDAITEHTRAVIATHLFGYPLNVDALHEIVRNAERRFGHKIWIIQDCAHSFGAKWRGKMVCSAGDASLFGLNISKMITSIFGGMITTDNDEIYKALKRYREVHFNKPGIAKTLRRILYLLAIYIAFHERFYGITYWLQEKTSILDVFTKQYHLDQKIHFPPDYLDLMLPIEGLVGLVQLEKYPEIIEFRREQSQFYDRNLRDTEKYVKPPLVEGATYSHHVFRVADREAFIASAAKKGVHIGRLIEYSIPHTAPYIDYASAFNGTNSLYASNSVINLPSQRLTSQSLHKIIGILKAEGSNVN